LIISLLDIPYKYIINTNLGSQGLLLFVFVFLNHVVVVVYTFQSFIYLRML
jgi:hypothetical protein